MRQMLKLKPTGSVRQIKRVSFVLFESNDRRCHQCRRAGYCSKCGGCDVCLWVSPKENCKGKGCAGSQKCIHNQRRAYCRTCARENVNRASCESRIGLAGQCPQTSEPDQPSHRPSAVHSETEGQPNLEVFEMDEDEPSGDLSGAANFPDFAVAEIDPAFAAPRMENGVQLTEASTATSSTEQDIMEILKDEMLERSSEAMGVAAKQFAETQPQNPHVEGAGVVCIKTSPSEDTHDRFILPTSSVPTPDLAEFNGQTHGGTEDGAGLSCSVSMIAPSMRASFHGALESVQTQAGL